MCQSSHSSLLIAGHWRLITDSRHQPQAIGPKCLLSVFTVITITGYHLSLINLSLITYHLSLITVTITDHLPISHQSSVTKLSASHNFRKINFISSYSESYQWTSYQWSEVSAIYQYATQLRTAEVWYGMCEVSITYSTSQKPENRPRSFQAELWRRARTTLDE